MRGYEQDISKYLCDVFRRLKGATKDKLVNLLPHTWQPAVAQVTVQ